MNAEEPAMAQEINRGPGPDPAPDGPPDKPDLQVSELTRPRAASVVHSGTTHLERSGLWP
jgi:hypothetical protein